MSTTQPITSDPVQPGLVMRLTDQRRLSNLAQVLLSAPQARLRVQVYGHVFAAWGQLAHGDRAAAEAALARGLALAMTTGDAECLAVCRGVQADLWLRDGRFGDVLGHCDTAMALPPSTLPPMARYLDAMRRSLALSRGGQLEAAMRAYYERLALARQIGTPAVLCDALANLGGFQASLMNLVDGLSLGDEAWSICRDTDWYTQIQTSGPNRMCTLSGVGRHDEACAMAEILMAGEPQFAPQHRHARQCLYAVTFAKAGRLAQAQTLLDGVLAERHDIAELRPEWVWVQACVWNRSGRPAEALALVLPHLARLGEEFKEGFLPEDLTEMCAEAALACEATGDLAGALRFERRAATARAQAAARSADVRRLTLQIGHDLDTARRQRDQALREQTLATQEQQRLADLNAQLEAANAAKTRFLAAASHDLRQPVQALAMYMAALQRERTAGRRSDLMVRMDQSLQALGSMFDVLLDVSRLDAGLVTVQSAPLRLDLLLQRLLDEHELQARERGLALRLRLPRGCAAPTTHSDPVLLETCLRNLLGNAVKYTAHGGVVVRLLAHGEPAHWRVEVRDTGIGIDAAVQPQVFDEFFQVGNDERDRSKGLGLGLSIVRRTLRLLGHPLCLQSRPGRGSSFRIDLPCIDAADAETDLPPTVPRSEARGGLIVVDDDAAVRDSLAALLQRWGHVVVQGADAEEALAAWQALGRPGVAAAIVDLRLRAGNTGLDAIAVLRNALGAGLPALVVTGDTAAERLRLLAAAGQPWLPKPLMPMRLRSWLASL